MHEWLLIFPNSLFLAMERDEVKEMINKKKTGSETLAAYEEHLNQVTSLVIKHGLL